MPRRGEERSSTLKEKVDENAILESHPYRRSRALQRIPRYAALETRTTAICLSALRYFMHKKWRLRSLDAPALFFLNEPDGLVDNEGHRGGGSKA